MIVLASSSPRRHQLLEMLGIPHTVDPASVPERPEPSELPEAMAVRLAREKAQMVRQRHPGAAVLGADTVVVVGDEMLGKPLDASDAVRMLSKLSGRDHRVVTAVALAVPDGRVLERFDVTRVWVRQLTEEQVRDYVATGDPLDKAGSYGVQSVGAVLVERVDGDFFSVMGLPIRLVTDLLAEGGMPYRFTR